MKQLRLLTSATAVGPRSSALFLTALLAAVTSTAGWAASATTQDKAQQRMAEQRFQEERAVCNSGRSNQDRATCLLEAQSAYAEARKGVLGDGETPQPSNLNQRCQALAGDEQRDCLARMNGQGSTSGSVQGGGILRELKTYKVEAQPTAAPAPALPASAPK